MLLAGAALSAPASRLADRRGFRPDLRRPVGGGRESAPGARIHSFDSMGHNWWGVCVAGGGLCSLALLGDEPRAPEWIDAVDAGLVQWFNYSGNVLHNRMPGNICSPCCTTSRG